MLSSILPWDVYPRLQNKPFGECFMNKHKITTKLIIGSLLLVSIPMMVPAETLSQILTAQTERTLLAQETQQRVDKISDQTNKLVDQPESNTQRNRWSSDL